MLTKPTTEQVLLGVIEHLNEQIAPELRSDSARVALDMVTQVIRGCAARAGHEIAWMHEEMAAIAVATGEDHVGVASLHLDDVVDAYGTASSHLADAVDHAYTAGDTATAHALRELLKVRSGHEMAIVGALELVGRG